MIFLRLETLILAQHESLSNIINLDGPSLGQIKAMLTIVQTSSVK